MALNVGKTHPFTLRHTCIHLAVCHPKWVNIKIASSIPPIQLLRCTAGYGYGEVHVFIRKL